MLPQFPRWWRKEPCRWCCWWRGWSRCGWAPYQGGWCSEWACTALSSPSGPASAVPLSRQRLTLHGSPCSDDAKPNGPFTFDFCIILGYPYGYTSLMLVPKVKKSVIYLSEFYQKTVRYKNVSENNHKCVRFLSENCQMQISVRTLSEKIWKCIRNVSDFINVSENW